MIPKNSLPSFVTAGSYHNEELLLKNVCPDLYAKKPEGSVRQHAFILNVINNLDAQSKGAIISVGNHEDVLFDFLGKMEYTVDGIDPVAGYSLEKFVQDGTHGKYYIAFATSVIEHVEDDIAFIKDMKKLLQESSVKGQKDKRFDGVGILTFDFLDAPEEQRHELGRMYTIKRVNKLKEALGDDVEFLTNDDYIKEPKDFNYLGHTYSFGTLVFRIK